MQLYDPVPLWPFALIYVRLPANVIKMRHCKDRQVVIGKGDARLFHIKSNAPDGSNSWFRRPKSVQIEAISIVDS